MPLYPTVPAKIMTCLHFIDFHNPCGHTVEYVRHCGECEESAVDRVPLYPDYLPKADFQFKMQRNAESEFCSKSETQIHSKEHSCGCQDLLESEFYESTSPARHIQPGVLELRRHYWGIHVRLRITKEQTFRKAKRKESWYEAFSTFRSNEEAQGRVRPYVYDPEAKSSKFLIAIDSKSLASENLCPICLDPLNDQSQDPRKLQQCTHIYHKDCIGNWIANFNSDCPYCRAKCRIFRTPSWEDPSLDLDAKCRKKWTGFVDFGGVLIQGKLVIWDAGVFEANSGKDAYGIDGAKVLR
jgi:Ring finger domain